MTDVLGLNLVTLCGVVLVPPTLAFLFNFAFDAVSDSRSRVQYERQHGC